MTPSTGTFTRRSARRRRVAAVTLVLVALAATLTGCTSARDTLGTRASACFEALPVAADAVHHRGTFAGVRQLTLKDFSGAVHLKAQLAPLLKNVHAVCVVSYEGSFTFAQVERPVGHPPAGGVGRYAIVIVSKPQNHLLGTVVRLTQPVRFGHPL